MTFLDKITGNDMTRELKSFEARVKELPGDYQDTWENIKENLWHHSDFTGRNLMPILESALYILKETATDGQSVKDASNTFRDKWRKELNNNISKKLGK